MRAQDIISARDSQMVGKYNNHYHSGNTRFPIFLALFRAIFISVCFALLLIYNWCLFSAKIHCFATAFPSFSDARSRHPLRTRPSDGRKVKYHYHSGNSRFPIFLVLFREIFHIIIFALDEFNLYSKKEGWKLKKGLFCVGAGYMENTSVTRFSCGLEIKTENKM